MEQFLSSFMQIVFFLCGPLVVFGLAVFFCRALFVALVGDSTFGRRLLLFAFTLSTPLRELGHAFMAVLFFHSVEDIKLLDVHAPDGELGFVEHSYNPKNPVALLGNFFYALGPLCFGLAAVYLVFLVCFGNAMPDLIAKTALLAESGGDFGEYFGAAAGLLPTMFEGGGVGIIAKIVGVLLLLLLCMGAFVSVYELTDAFSGFVIFCGITAAFSAILMLFDARVQRLVLGALRGFAAVVTALNLVLLLAVAALLLIGGVWFLWRFLFGTEQESTALQPYRGDRERD